MAKYDVERMRANLRKQLGGRTRDPNEFIPPKAAPGKTLNYVFYVLGPLNQGDPCHGGTASRDCDNFFVPFAQHWINSKPNVCPRVTEGEKCDMCDTGFKLLKEAKDANQPKEVRGQLRSDWLPNNQYVVNIYFPNVSTNPEEVRGRVMYFKAPQSVYIPWEEAMFREDAGDDQLDPQAFGPFFDENNAFMFKLVIVNKANTTYNDYTKSKFLVKAANGDLARGPIVQLQDGSADEAEIQAILDQRFDLWHKLEKADPAQIKRITATLLDGDDDSDGGGFDQDETTPPQRQSQPARAAAPPARAAAPQQRQTQPARTAQRQPVQEDELEEAPRSAPRGRTQPVVQEEELLDEAPRSAPRGRTQPVVQEEELLDEAPRSTGRSVASRPAPANSGPDDEQSRGAVTDDPELDDLMGQLNR